MPIPLYFFRELKVSEHKKTQVVVFDRDLKVRQIISRNEFGFMMFL